MTHKQTTGCLKGLPRSIRDTHKPVASIIPNQGYVSIICCDRLAMKTFTYSPMENEIALSGTMQFPHEAKEVAILEFEDK